VVYTETPGYGGRRNTPLFLKYKHQKILKRKKKARLVVKKGRNRPDALNIEKSDPYESRIGYEGTYINAITARVCRED